MLLLLHPAMGIFFLGSIKASLPLIVLVAFLRWTMRENTRWGERFTPNGRTKGAEGGGWGRGEQELKRLSVCLSGLEYGIVAIIGRILPGHG